MSAVIRALVLRRRAAQEEARRLAEQRDEIIAAAKGDKGDAGEKGSMPAHEWRGTQLRFEQPGGGWGKWTDLKGPPGKPGAAGAPGARGRDGAPGTGEGSPAELVTPPPLLIQGGRIALPSEPLGGLLQNMALVFADLQPAEILPDGSLFDRDYLVEEHMNVIVEGSEAVFTDADGTLDGRYAQVSYITWKK